MRARAIGTAAVILTLSTPFVASAQTTADYRRQLDILEPQWRAALAAVEAKEQARRQAARSVMMDRGPLRLVVDSALVPLVVGPAEQAARILESTFGDAAGTLVGRPLAVRTSLPVRSADTTPLIRVGTPGRETSLPLGDSAQTRARLFAALTGPRVTGVLHAELDDSARNWIRAPLPAGRESPSERERVYVDLVTASTDISRRCLAGDVGGCRELLGLAPVEDPLLQGHTAVQRRGLVATRTAQLRTTGHTREFDRCVASHDDQACIARLRTLPPETFSRSIASSDMHRSFLRSVLARGEMHAYDRFRSTDSLPLEARLAAAGRAPLDTLIVAWRAGILAVRPSRTPLTPAAAFATMAWVLAAGALALRSSRWR